MLKKIILGIIGLEEKKYLLEHAEDKICDKLTDLKYEYEKLLNTKIIFDMKEPVLKSPKVSKPAFFPYLIFYLVIAFVIVKYMQEPSYVLIYSLIVFLIGIFYFYFRGLYIYNEECDKCKKAYNRKCEEYNKSLDSYNDSITTKNKKLKEFKSEISKCESLLEKVVQQRIDVSVQLEKLYAKGNIHPKYQNIVAMATIYDYLSTGICTILEGPNGAYKFYEEQAMRHLIATSLSEAMNKVIKNQKTLESKISNMNREMSNIQIELKDTDKNYQALSSRIAKLKAPDSIKK